MLGVLTPGHGAQELHAVLVALERQTQLVVGCVMPRGVISRGTPCVALGGLDGVPVGPQRGHERFPQLQEVGRQAVQELVVSVTDPCNVDRRRRSRFALPLLLLLQLLLLLVQVLVLVLVLVLLVLVLLLLLLMMLL